MEIQVYEKPRKFRTRHGSLATVFARGPYFIASVGEAMFGVVESGGYSPCSWSLSGKFNPFTVGDNDLDLLEEL